MTINSIVNVTVSTAQVQSGGGSNLNYIFTRSGDLSSALTVNFDVTGTATRADYKSSVDVTSTPTKIWTKSLTSASDVYAYASNTGPDGSVYVSGGTFGNMDGQSLNGNSDAFLTKFSSEGSKAWTKLLGSSNPDMAMAQTLGADGSIYIGGYTTGNIDGQINSGSSDGFITKYLPDGTKLWTRLIGTGSDLSSTVKSITTGVDGSIYVSGISSDNLNGQSNNGNFDGFVTKFSADGTQLWTKLIGTSAVDDATSIIAGKDGSIYVCGYINGQFNVGANRWDGEAFLAKFLPDGTQVWLNTLSTTSSALAYSVTTGLDGAIYISGDTIGNLNGEINNGLNDAFVAKFLPDGNRVWTKLLGTGASDASFGLTTGVDGSLFVTGFTQGNLDGISHNGTNESFITKFLTDGTKEWTRLFGSNPIASTGQALTSSLDGSIYVAGLAMYPPNDPYYDSRSYQEGFLSKYKVNSQIIFEAGASTKTLVITPDPIISTADASAKGSLSVNVIVYNGVGYDVGYFSVSRGIITNVITGSNGNDVLKGTSGNDILVGELGNDQLNGGDGSDTASYSTATLGVKVSLALITAQNTIGAGWDTLSSIENVIGGVGNDTLIGNNYANMLDGGPGVDTLMGGAANDTYIVDLVDSTGLMQDRVVEVISGGTADTIMLRGASSNVVAVTLKAPIGIENLDASATGTSKLNLSGNTSNNVLTGNDADNIFDGGLGLDTLIGGAGNDTYIVHSITDTIIELPWSGVDTILSSVTYSLNLLTAVENLTLTGNADINATGNESDNVLIGNRGANVLIGGGGNDTLIGGVGNDVLTGGAGIDHFVFNVLAYASPNKDTITDFVHGTDVFDLSKSAFKGLGLTTGMLSSAAFYAGAGISTAHDLDDRIIYNTANGALYYDSDGSGKSPATQIAILTNIPLNLSHDDFMIIG